MEYHTESATLPTRQRKARPKAPRGSGLPPLSYGDGRLLRNMSAENAGRLLAQLIAPDRTLTPADKRLAEYLMVNL